MSLRKLLRVRSIAALPAVAATLLLLTGCVGGAATAPGTAGTTTLHLVGFAVPKEANNAIQEKFAQTAEGKDVVWQESYGASGDQSRAVVNGLQADYVNFSLEGDVTRLVEADLVDASWNSGPTKGIVSASTVVIVVQKGNPLGIKDWSDLVKPGVKIVTPNPASSGSARWNILAAYQQMIANGGTEAEAKEYLTQFFNHVAALPGSGRDATNAFLEGAANVLISYENEAILARQAGEDFDYIVPDATIKIENPGAVLKNANPKANAYFDFVLSKAGQEEFVKKGFRPVIADTPIGEVAGSNDPTKPFPTPPRLFTISDLGGWEAVNAKFFDEATGLVPQIQQETGRSQ
jgi:sulfate/thiosulfate transport system substrate-binding protein